jgi:transcriptional regulator with XRE-family HTH domain
MAIFNVNNFYKEMGSLIKAERLKCGVSQELLGNQLNLTRASVINLEKGRHRPSIYQLILIAEALQTDYTKLVPVINPRIKKTKKEILNDLDNAITDQDKIDKSTRTAVLNFLSSLKKQ